MARKAGKDKNDNVFIEISYQKEVDITFLFVTLHTNRRYKMYHHVLMNQQNENKYLIIIKKWLH